MRAAGTVDPVSDPRAAAASQAYPGQRLGLPEDGPGSVAGWGRRALALAVDWLASMMVAAMFVGTAVWSGRDPVGWVPLLVYWVEASLLTALVGGSFGQVVTRIAVVRLDRRPLGLLQSVLRTLLICLVVPPLVFNRDQRGLHDLVTGAITLRR